MIVVHYLDNALLGVLGIDKQWSREVWLVYSKCNIKGTAWCHAICLIHFTTRSYKCMYLTTRLYRSVAVIVNNKINIAEISQL